MPLFANTTAQTEFTDIQEYLNECQTKAFQEDMRTKIEILSLSNISKPVICQVGDECSDRFKKSIDPTLFILEK
jgi:hypothetical protein